MQTTTKTSSLKVSFLNGIQEKRSLIRQPSGQKGVFLVGIGREREQIPKNLQISKRL
jgi:hypothetical protein